MHIYTYIHFFPDSFPKKLLQLHSRTAGKRTDSGTRLGIHILAPLALTGV